MLSGIFATVHTPKVFFAIVHGVVVILSAAKNLA
jgi:hypothetical protein